MKLRQRLILTIGAITLMLLGVLSWLRFDGRRRAVASGLTSFALSLAEVNECPLPLPSQEGVRFFVYDDALKSTAPDAPDLPRDLLAKLGENERAPHGLMFRQQPFPDLGDKQIATRSFPDGAEVIVRLHAGSPACTYLLARKLGAERATDLLLELASDLLAPGVVALTILLILWLSLSNVVNRLQRLREAVTDVAAGGHQGRIAQDLGTDEIGDLAAAFNAAGAQVRTHVGALKEREQTLREFLANTTHDVMIPLTVMQGALSQLPPDVVLARTQAYYIGSLLGNLSATAKLEAGTTLILHNTIALDRLLERAVERYRGIASEKGVTLELVLPGTSLAVEADPTLVEQCVSNLIFNAVRYNRSGGHVTVILDEEGKRFLIRVIDDGPGMTAEERRVAMRRGFRSQRARREHAEGMGLGLSIAHAVAERHGWSLELASAPTGGIEARVGGPRSTEPDQVS